MNNFQYKSDYNYFLKKLANGDKILFEKKFSKMFDFRSPLIKRKEFNLIRNKVYKELILKYGEKCQLNLCPDCGEIKKFDVDHFIPLSTNKLNKLLRNLKPEVGKKVASQSFGSNDVSNLRIACKRCNSFKKHKIIL
ncbi:MAG: HNH endonuclease [Clostridia bacterium]|nr:HNH endonuclease [Clostridia bacterium]